MVVTKEDENNTSKYQETMNVDIEIIANIKNWRPIYKVIYNSYFAATSYLQ